MQGEKFTEDDLAAKEPIGQFKSWFSDASNTLGILNANAMCIATATKNGRPSARYVFLRGFGKEGFRFFTNYASRKGRELEENPFASLVFYWEPLRRSVRIEGHVERISEAESDDYFHSRPRSYQIGVYLSPQSQVISDLHDLTDKEQLPEKYKDETSVISRPKTWGGFRVVPSVVEFVQSQLINMYDDRIAFRIPADGELIDPTYTHQGEDGWVFERLAP